MKLAAKIEKRDKETVSESFFQRLKKDIIRNKMKYIMVLPVVIWYVIFIYLPMYGITIAFQDYEPSLGFFKSPWVGFEHFKAFFKDVYFVRLLVNTLRISLMSIVLGFPAPIFLSLLINEVNNKHFVKTVQTLTYLPHFISLVVVCGMIKSFLGPSGFITQFIYQMTGNEVSLMASPKAFPWIYVVSTIWQEVGWGSIIYLSALSAINTELYEACEIDGGGRLKQTIHVTLPGIAPTIIIMLIMRMGAILGVGYEKVILLYNSSNMKTADVIQSYVYRIGLSENLNFSYATAVNLFNSVVSVMFVWTVNKISKKYSETSLW